MTESFVKRSKYPFSAFVDKATFEYLLSRLNQLGFNDQYIILPQAVIQDDKKIIPGPKDKLLRPSNFLDLDQNYQAVILRATNSDKEEISILFKNDFKNRVTFDNNIYSLVDSSPISNLYVSTNSPITTYSISFYLIDFFKDQVRNLRLKKLLFALTIILGIIWGCTIAIYQQQLIIFASASLIFIAWIVLVVILLPASGLHVSTSKKGNRPRAVDELIKNWLTILITVILSTLFGLMGSLIAKTLGW